MAIKKTYGENAQLIPDKKTQRINQLEQEKEQLKQDLETAKQDILNIAELALDTLFQIQGG